MPQDFIIFGGQPSDSSSNTVYSSFPDGLRVVLEGEDLPRAVEDLPGSGLEPERALLAAQLPDDLPGVPVHLVGRPGVTPVDQQVPAGVEVNGVDVEPVPGTSQSAVVAIRSGRRTGQAPGPA